MHESALVKDLVREMDALARDNGRRRVARAYLRLGALAPVSPAALREQFCHAAEGTLAEGADLTIETDTELDLKDRNSLGVLLECLELSRPATDPFRDLSDPNHA